MTRLATDDIRSISAGLAGYESELSAKTGYSLRGIACQAADVNEEEIKDSLKNALIGVIPITGGLGIIGGFSDAVAGIVAHMGCKTFITQVPDVAGLAEAFEQKADIILLADDHRFIALQTATGLLIDNAAATGKGFVAGMHLMAGELNKRNVLVIGCGPEGGVPRRNWSPWGPVFRFLTSILLAALICLLRSKPHAMQNYRL